MLHSAAHFRKRIHPPIARAPSRHRALFHAASPAVTLHAASMARSLCIAACALTAAAASAASAAPSAAAPPALPLPLCVLYADGKTNQFMFGNLVADGTLTSLVTLPTWDAVENGIDMGEDNRTFYTEPSIGGARRARAGKRVPGVPVPGKALRGGGAGGAGGGATLATITVDKRSASVSYATLAAAPGHAGQPDAIADCSLDAGRGQMVGTVESAGGAIFFLIADLFPSNGTISTVWRDLTAQWYTWAWLKYGVAAYDDGGQTYYLTVGVKDGGGGVTETVMGWPLANASAPPVALPLPPGYDLLALRWSKPLRAPIALATDRTKLTLTWLAYSPSAKAWAPFLSYPPGTVTSMQLGQVEISGDGALAIASLQDAKTGGFLISYVSVAAKKEVARFTLADNRTLVADIALCDA
jgi:hypothetical protein